MYDTLYQEWLAAKRNKDFPLADKLREDFERLHGLTIYAEGDLPIIGVTVRRMLASKYQKKFGNPKVGKIMVDYDSKVRALPRDSRLFIYLGKDYPKFPGTFDRGYHESN